MREVKRPSNWLEKDQDLLLSTQYIQCEHIYISLDTHYHNIQYSKYYMAVLSKILGGSLAVVLAIMS